MSNIGNVVATEINNEFNFIKNDIKNDNKSDIFDKKKINKSHKIKEFLKNKIKNIIIYFRITMVKKILSKKFLKVKMKCDNDVYLYYSICYRNKKLLVCLCSAVNTRTNKETSNMSNCYELYPSIEVMCQILDFYDKNLKKFQKDFIFDTQNYENLNVDDLEYIINNNIYISKIDAYQIYNFIK